MKIKFNQNMISQKSWESKATANYIEAFPSFKNTDGRGLSAHLWEWGKWTAIRFSPLRIPLDFANRYSFTFKLPLTI